MRKRVLSRLWRCAGAAALVLCAGSVRADVAFMPGDYYVLDLKDGILRRATNVASPARFKADEYKTTKIVFRKIPAGSFTMHAEEAHPATVSLGEFAIAIYELTQGQYATLKELRALPGLKGNQNQGAGEKMPAHFLSYDHSKKVVQAVASFSTPSWRGVTVAFPNEAQWEKAARGGTATKWYFGGSAADIALYAWCNDGGGFVHEVGSKLPNPFGLYDVYGNVREWCCDCWWGAWYSGNSWDACICQPGGYGAPGDANSGRVQRGGAAMNVPDDCTSSSRNYFWPQDTDPVAYMSSFGLRLILQGTLPTNLPEEPAPAVEEPWDDTTVYPADEPAAAACAPRFTIDRVQQHYPWDGKIDIHYTLSGVDSSRFHALYFTATGGGKSMTIFVKDRGGPSDPTGKDDEVLARDGSHCYTWDLLVPSTNSTQCGDNAAVTTLTNVFARGTAKVSGRIVDTGAPVKVLRGDYKILDIAAGKVTERKDVDPLQFNTEQYKTTHIAFRKIKARPSMKVKEDFYIAVFPMTMAQMRLFNGGVMPETYHWGWRWNTENREETVTGPDGKPTTVVHSKVRTDKASGAPYKGDWWWDYQETDLFPMNRISYNDLRGTSDNRVNEAVKGNLGNKEDGTPSLFLKYRMAHGVGLDLPNGFEWELAARGNTTYERWFFGDDDVNMGYYAWYWDNSLPYTCVKCLNRVGSRYPNQFGLWDVYGNVWQMCRNYLNNSWDPEYSVNWPSPRELRGGTSFFRSRHASHYRPYPLDIGAYPGEEFGGNYNWEGYHFYGFRPILVSH